MCGIVGFYDASQPLTSSIGILHKMLETIRHRGPNDGGVWHSHKDGIYFGHRRLSILELSEAGHQPMQSFDHKFSIIFNGEIYNHLALRKELESSGLAPLNGWRGNSDTETLLTCFSAWGIEKSLKATIGMFALALWDEECKTLTLARDRVGEKPLFYGWQNNTFLFGSELKALKVNPSFMNRENWHAANTFLHLNYIPAPSTIYDEIFKLLPGTYLQLSTDNFYRRTTPSPVQYWSLQESALSGASNPFLGDYQDAIVELELLIRQSTTLQSMADVPVGAFLSGGVDSSLVVAMMQSAMPRELMTFTIGMPDKKMDESEYASDVAQYLGTRHTQHIIRPEEALDLIPRLSQIWDEPFADSSQIPTFLVSQIASREVKVALSGDGGDEFFLGYSQYSLYQKIWRLRFLKKLPWRAIFHILSPIAGVDVVHKSIGRAQLIIGAWDQKNPQELNRYWLDRYKNNEIPIMQSIGVDMVECPILGDPASTAALWDAATYLPDDILVKVDRASMANSLETRAPLLDHRIIEFAHRLPVDYKLDKNKNKRILRDVLYKHVPKRLIDRPKMGFSIPLHSWLRGELRPWAEGLLEGIPSDSDFFNKKEINLMWREHLNGHRNNTEKIWAILSLLAHQQ